MQLSPEAVARGVRLQVYDTLGSTNVHALDLARAGERGPMWVVARRQTSGRGRRGRAWVSEQGNLYASLLLREPSPPDRAPELCFVAALAGHDAIVEVGQVAPSRLTLKWPNDILLDGAKCAGILIEGESMPVLAVIGIGVNCKHHPANASYPATDLAAAGIACSPDDIFAVLSAAILLRLDQWNGGAGFAAIRADWLARAAGRGETIRIGLPGRAVDGQFETLDERGRLVLRLPDGLCEHITAGDVLAARSLTGAER